MSPMTDAALPINDVPACNLSSKLPESSPTHNSGLSLGVLAGAGGRGGPLRPHDLGRPATVPLAAPERPVTAASGVEGHRSLLHSVYVFRVDAPMRNYIWTKTINRKDQYTLAEVLNELKILIREGEMFDPKNPAIIICDKDLEAALNMKALHVTEIREQVLGQMVRIAGPQPIQRNNFSLLNGIHSSVALTAPCSPLVHTLPQLSTASNTVVSAASHSTPPSAANTVLPAVSSSTIVTVPAPANTVPPAVSSSTIVTVPAAANTVPPAVSSSIIVTLPAAAVGQQQVAVAPIPSMTISEPITSVVGENKNNAGNKAINMANVYADKSSRFELKPLFREALLNVPEMDRNQTVFSYDEITVLLSKYILGRKEELFDPRNIKLAMVQDDPLGKAFNVNAFHRCQVTSLLRNQLVYVNPTSSSSSSKKTESNLTIPPFPSLSKANSMPAGSRSLEETIRAGLSKTRKRSTSGDAMEDRNPSKLKSLRRQSPGHQMSGMTPVAASDADTEEEKEVKEDVEDGDEEEEEDGDSDSEVYEVEYELDTGEEDDRPSLAGGGSASSAEDSDLECVVSQEVKQVEEDTDNWADSETDLYIVSKGVPVAEPSRGGGRQVPPREKVLDPVDLELGKEDNWECASCRTPNIPHYRYCGACWQVRKGWLPDRPRPTLKSRKQRNERRERERERRRQEVERRRNKSASVMESDDNSPAPAREAVDQSGGKNSHYSGTTSDDNETDGGCAMGKPDAAAATSNVSVSADSGVGSQDTGIEDTADHRVHQPQHQQQQKQQQEIVAGPVTCLSPPPSLAVSKNVPSPGPGVHAGGGTEKVPALQRAGSVDSSSGVSSLEDPSLQVGAGRSLPMLCMFCCQRPKNASLIHGRLGHQVCCYPCAKKLWKKQARCPVCRRKIEKIVKNITA